MSQTPETQMTEKSLLDLPTELWSRICKLAVTYDEPINILAIMEKEYLRYTDAEQYRCSTEEYKKHRSMLAQPAITKVCRTIRNECLPHYYKANLFYSYSHNLEDKSLLIDKWLRDYVKPDNRKFLGRVYYKMGMPVIYPNYTWVNCLTSRQYMREQDFVMLLEHGYGHEETDGWVVRLITAESMGSEAERERLWNEEVENAEDPYEDDDEEDGESDDDDGDDDDEGNEDEGNELGKAGGRSVGG